MSYKLLVVDKSSLKVNEIVHFLRAKNFYVDTAEDGINARCMVADGDYNLAIIDIDIIGINGYDLCRNLKKNFSIEIILMTENVNEHDELQAFSSGADDFISKRISKEILFARIRRLIDPVIKYYKEVTVGDVTVNFGNSTVFVRGSYIELTKMELLILKYLFSNMNVITSREAIIENIKGNDFFGDMRIVDTHIKNIRKKIGKGVIITVKGLGYLVREKKY